MNTVLHAYNSNPTPLSPKEEGRTRPGMHGGRGSSTGVIISVCAVAAKLNCQANAPANKSLLQDW